VAHVVAIRAHIEVHGSEPNHAYHGPHLTLPKVPPLHDDMKFQESRALQKNLAPALDNMFIDIHGILVHIWDALMWCMLALLQACRWLLPMAVVGVRQD